MRRSIAWALFLYAFVLGTCLNAQDDFRKPENLKKRTNKVFQIPPEGGEEAVAYHSVQEFDEQGNITKQAQFVLGGVEAVEFICKNEYDAEKRLISTQKEDPLGENQIKAVIKYGEKKSRTVTTENFTNQQLVIRGVQTYGPDGKLTGETLENKVYGVSGERVYEYGADGNLKKMLQTYGVKKIYISYVTDAKGRVTEETIFDADDKQIKRQTNKWNDKGDNEEFSQFGSDDARVFKMTYAYKYDATGYPTEALAVQFFGDEPEPTAKARIVWEYELFDKK